MFFHCSSPSHQEIILIDSVIKKCIIMNLSEHVGLVFVSKFPNFKELTDVLEAYDVVI